MWKALEAARGKKNHPLEGLINNNNIVIPLIIRFHYQGGVFFFPASLTDRGTASRFI